MMPCIVGEPNAKAIQSMNTQEIKVELGMRAEDREVFELLREAQRNYEHCGELSAQNGMVPMDGLRAEDYNWQRPLTLVFSK